MRARATGVAGRRRILLTSAVVTITVAAIATTSTAVTAPQAFQLISTSTPPPPPSTLAANDHGYVRVTTASNAIGCSISAELVACETSSNSWPSRSNGQPFHTVSVDADGKLQFVDADLGALAGKVELESGTYAAQGWTVTATVDTLSFANARTGHGMRVSTQSVQSF